MNGILRAFVATRHRAGPFGLALGVSAAALALMLQTPMAHAQSQQNEIVKSDTSQSVQGTVPAGMDVNVSDESMKAANGNRRDWLLHGRTYSNQRYSPLRQINSRNVRGLKPVAIIQTAHAGELRDNADRGRRGDVRHHAGGRQQDEDHGLQRRERRPHLGDHLRSRRLQDLLRAGQPRRRGRLRQRLCASRSTTNCWRSTPRTARRNGKRSSPTRAPASPRPWRRKSMTAR